MRTLLTQMFPALAPDARAVRAAAKAARGIETGAKAPSNLQITLDTASLDHFTEFARTAKSSLVGDLFLIEQPNVLRGIKTLKTKGVTQRFLVDPEHAKTHISFLPKHDSVHSAVYGAMPYKNHAKAYAVDGERALLTTGAFHELTPTRYELVAQFDGEAARYLDSALNAAIDGNDALQRSALEALRPFGVVYNEPRLGVAHLTESVYGLLEGAGKNSKIAISSKFASDAGFVKRLTAAQQRGADVIMTPRYVNGTAGQMHGNLLIVDDAMYLGSAHFSPRGMGDMNHAYRRVRDSGLIIRDQQQVDLMRKTFDDTGFISITTDEFTKVENLSNKVVDLNKQLAAAHAEPAKAAQIEEAIEASNALWKELFADLYKARRADGVRFSL